jgi:hypothetical protein
MTNMTATALPATPDEALQRLIEGNARFVRWLPEDGQTRSPNQT